MACPAKAVYGSSANATVTASDGQSGLSVDPSGTVPIDTTTVGSRTTSATAVDNVGHSAEASCTTKVEYSLIISGTFKGNLTVSKGQGVEIAPGRQSHGCDQGQVRWRDRRRGRDALRRSGDQWRDGRPRLRHDRLRPVKASGTTGPVTIGESGGSCAASTFFSNVAVKNSKGAVVIEGTAMVEENMFHGSLAVSSNSGGTTVRNNTVNGSLTVKGNTGTVIDSPNTVEGKSKVQ